MKIKYILTVAALLVVASIPTGRSVKAEQKPERREVVVLWGSLVGFNNGSHYQYDGARLLSSSSSAGAPVFQQATVPLTTNTVELAEAIAESLNQGFHIQHIENSGQPMFILVK